MHGAAVYAHAGFERAAVRVESRERGQQRRMDVDQPPGVTLDERIGEYAHETGEHDEVGPVAVDRFDQRGVECSAVGVTPMIYRARRYAALDALSQGRAHPGSLLSTAHIVAGNPASSSATMLLPRPEISMTMRFTVVPIRRRPSVLRPRGGA